MNRNHPGGWLVAWLSIAALASSGCIAISVVKLQKEPLDSTVTDVRVSRRQADVGGTSCYVDKQYRTNKRWHISRTMALFGILETIVGVAVLGEGQSLKRGYEEIGGGIVVLDGLSTAIFVINEDGSVHASESWQQTTETASCPP